MSLNYDQLKQQILNYAQKEAYDEAGSGDKNFTDAIPFFFNIALEKINRDVHTLNRNKVVRGSVKKSDYTFSKPTQWIQTLSLYVGTGIIDLNDTKRTPLFKRSFEFCKNFIGQEEGIPKFYADSSPPDNQIIIVPVPSTEIYYELTYEANLPLLDLSSINPGDLNSSWVMQKYPSLLFYATYIEALRYMGKGDEIPLFQSLYDETVKSINLQNTSRNVDRTTTIEKT